MISSWKLSLFWYLPTYFRSNFKGNHKKKSLNFKNNLKNTQKIFNFVIQKKRRKMWSIFSPKYNVLHIFSISQMNSLLCWDIEWYILFKRRNIQNANKKIRVQQEIKKIYIILCKLFVINPLKPTDVHGTALNTV